MSSLPSCLYCGSTIQIEIDHIVPRKRGGLDIVQNRVHACRRCNVIKNDRLPSEWRSDFPDRVYELERIAVEFHPEIKPRKPKRKPAMKKSQLNIRCTSQQKAIIEKAAQSEGMGASTWLLRLGLVAVEAKAKDAR